jgi:hypothetical protein
VGGFRFELTGQTLIDRPNVYGHEQDHDGYNRQQHLGAEADVAMT